MMDIIIKKIKILERYKKREEFGDLNKLYEDPFKCFCRWYQIMTDEDIEDTPENRERIKYMLNNIIPNSQVEMFELFCHWYQGITGKAIQDIQKTKKIFETMMYLIENEKKYLNL